MQSCSIFSLSDPSFNFAKRRFSLHAYLLAVKGGDGNFSHRPRGQVERVPEAKNFTTVTGSLMQKGAAKLVLNLLTK